MAREVIKRCDSTGASVPPDFRDHAKLLTQLEAEDALLYSVLVDTRGSPVACELAPLEVSLGAWREGQRA